MQRNSCCCGGISNYVPSEGGGVATLRTKKVVRLRVNGDIRIRLQVNRKLYYLLLKSIWRNNWFLMHGEEPSVMCLNHCVNGEGITATTASTGE